MDKSISAERARAPPNILVIEDAASDLRLLEEAFSETDSDATLQSTTNGKDAIDILSRVKSQHPAGLPGLVVTDLNLPERDGQAVVESIRNDLELSNLPVVILTGSNDSEDVQRCYEAGANAYLTKPARFDDLVSLVEAIETFWFTLAERPSQSERQNQIPNRRNGNTGSDASFLAVCRECDHSYAATTKHDGALQLEGGQIQCRCGSTAFALIGDGAPGR